jgi:sec-independent protein translocase protein TatC
MSRFNEFQTYTVTEHLSELRKRLVRVALIFLLGFAICYGFSEYIFNFIRAPILPFLPEGDRGLHYTGVFEKFMAHVKVSFLAGIILTCPLWLYQVWKFIAPGLYQKEKKYAVGFIASGIALFVGGASFAYWVVFPFAFKFLLGFGGDTDKPMITITEYLEFVLKFFLAFGVTFEMPVVLTFLGMMGIIDHKFLTKNRRWAILIMAILAATITPPDALSMMMLLAPLILLYETSVILVRFLGKPAGSGPAAEPAVAGENPKT